MADEKREWITVAEAAAIMGLKHIESVRRLCRKGKITCRQFVEGVSTWEVLRTDAEKYRRDYGGRPHKNEL
jgi:hypothetical protein